MWTNLLAEYITVSASAVYALIGFAVVFLGISLLIAVVWAVGKVMNRKNVAKPAQTTVKTVVQEVAVAESNEISDETVAVIMAALMAYYQANNPKCEFTVKRIKRI